MAGIGINPSWGAGILALAKSGKAAPQPGRSTLQKGTSGVLGSPASFGITKGIPGGGVLTTQPRPAGATPSTLPRPSQPSQPQAPAGPPSGGDPAAPLDSAALANIAANQFKVNNQINALNLQGSDAGTSLQSTLAQLAYQQPRQSLALEQKFNQGGGLYSSPEAQAQGDLSYQFLGKQGAAQSKYGQTMDSIASKIAGLQGGIPLFNDQQGAASAGRESRIAANAPAPAAAVAPGAPPAPSAAANRPGGTVVRPNARGFIRDVTRATPKLQSLASQIAGRKTVRLKPVQGKGRLRG